MRVRDLGGFLAGLTACTLVLAASADTPWTQALTAQALERGFLTRLPPNLSAAFGLAKPEQGTEVRQLLTRDAHQVRTFNVGVVKHSELVIFNVDTHTNNTVAYLLAPDGQLRQALSYRNVDQAQPLSAAEARTGFARERRFWMGRVSRRAPVAPVAPSAAPATTTP
jgi:hypothetical protein